MQLHGTRASHTLPVKAAAFFPAGSAPPFLSAREVCHDVKDEILAMGLSKVSDLTW